MSGSDWKKFVTSHREGKMSTQNHKREEDLVKTIISGSSRPKHFSDVNYDEVLSIIKEKKEKSHKQSIRVNRLARQSKERKKECLLKEHHKMWLKTFADLKQKATMCQLDIEQWQSNCVLNETTLMLNGALIEFIEMANNLQIQRTQFERNTREPISQLRRELLHYKKTRQFNSSFTKEDIIRKLKEFKELQKEVWLNLEAECLLINDEFQLIHKQVNSFDIHCPSFERGVPKEVWSLDCPDNKLRDLMIKEFTKVDVHYQKQLNSLDDQLKENLSGHDSGFHLDKDKLHFELIYEQYSPTQRSHCIDRMTIEMPHKTRQEIVYYEMQYCALKHHSKQKELIKSSWEQARKALTLKTVECFNQACKDWEGQQMIEKQRMAHSLMCMKLAEKVSEWRQKQLSKQELEAKEAIKKMVQQKALMEEEEKRELEKRAAVKEKLAQFHAKNEDERQREITKERKLIEQRRTELELQLQTDKERTRYRTQLYLQKLEDQHNLKDALEEETKRKEEQLEKLRKLVRIEAKPDPLRMLSDTQSSKARLLTTNEEASLNDPLFHVHSFTSEKVTSDKRFKVSEALREAGLLSTDYAKKILATISPPKEPRRDQYSSLFKQNQNINK